MGGSAYRNANPDATKPHSLVKKEKGVNRFVPGKYTCSCGVQANGIRAFEKHRSSARKADKVLISADK